MFKKKQKVINEMMRPRPIHIRKFDFATNFSLHERFEDRWIIWSYPILENLIFETNVWALYMSDGLT